jgi:hypothetical protein
MVGMLRAAYGMSMDYCKNARSCNYFLMNRKSTCFLAETHLTNQSCIKIKGYEVHHTVQTQNTARGGTAVLVKDNMVHHEEAKYATDEIQATAVTIEMKRQAITFAAAYCPSRYNLRKTDYLNLLRSLGERFMVRGVYKAKNTHWGSRLTTSKGKELSDAIKQLGSEYHSTSKPTYWPTDEKKITDLLDFLSLKISANYIGIEEEYGLSSDHSEIILTLSDTIIRKEANPTLVNILTGKDLKKTLPTRYNYQEP